MTGIVNMITGAEPKGAKAARQMQADALARQEAIAARAGRVQDNRATDLSAQDASMRRAIAARRKGSASLAFTGSNTAPATGLKSTFGG